METREGGREGASKTGQTMREAGEQMRATAAEMAERGRETGQKLADQTMAGARATDRAIREYPYESLGVAFGVGMLLGLLINRK